MTQTRHNSASFRRFKSDMEHSAMQSVSTDNTLEIWFVRCRRRAVPLQFDRKVTCESTVYADTTTTPNNYVTLDRCLLKKNARFAV